MPFDYEEYEKKCSTLSPEALQKEWENYTRHIAGSATSTAGSVLFAPFTAGASLVGLGLSTPRIHNARKKRAIIEEHLQAHGTTHHTRKRDVVAPMTVAGTLGGLTLGFAGAGADMIAGQAVGKGVEYVVSHAALEVAGATLEHKHDESKKMKDQLELSKKYGNVEGLGIDEKTSLLSPLTAAQSSLRKSKSETHLDGLAYGSLPKEKRPAKPPRPQPQPVQVYQVVLQPESKPENCSTSQSTASNPAPAIQTGNEDSENAEKTSVSGMKLPYIGLPDHDEAEKRGLRWDSARGMYVPPESANDQQAENLSPSQSISYTNLETPDNKHDELNDLLSQLIQDNSESLLLQKSSPVLIVPDEKPPSLPPRPQSITLPPRPKSSIGSYSTPTYQSVRPDRPSYIPPPPPPQQPSQQQAATGPVQQQNTPRQHYSPNQYSQSPSPSPLPAQLSYQPSRVQFPQYQYYPPPPPSPNYIPPPPARRPSPQPLQHQYTQAHTQQRHDSESSISTVSSATSSISCTTASTVSAASTPLTSYSSTTSMLTPTSSHSCDGASPKTSRATLYPSSGPVEAVMYFPPPPTGVAGGKEEKGEKWGYFS